MKRYEPVMSSKLIPGAGMQHLLKLTAISHWYRIVFFILKLVLAGIIADAEA